MDVQVLVLAFIPFCCACTWPGFLFSFFSMAYSLCEWHVWHFGPLLLLCKPLLIHLCTRLRRLLMCQQFLQEDGSYMTIPLEDCKHVVSSGNPFLNRDGKQVKSNHTFTSYKVLPRSVWTGLRLSSLWPQYMALELTIITWQTKSALERDPSQKSIKQSNLEAGVVRVLVLQCLDIAGKMLL